MEIGNVEKISYFGSFTRIQKLQQLTISYYKKNYSMGIWIALLSMYYTMVWPSLTNNAQ